jgi:hypothetical protein
VLSGLAVVTKGHKRDQVRGPIALLSVSTKDNAAKPTERFVVGQCDELRNLNWPLIIRERELDAGKVHVEVGERDRRRGRMGQRKCVDMGLDAVTSNLAAGKIGLCPVLPTDRESVRERSHNETIRAKRRDPRNFRWNRSSLFLDAEEFCS